MSFQNFSFFTVFEQTDFNFSFLGENKKNILVIFEEKNLIEDIEYIDKILSVAKINLKSDCLYTTCPSDLELLPSLALWFEKTNCTGIIIFGFDAKKFGCNFQNYLNSCIAFKDYKVVFCDTLERIKNSNTESKKQLREALLNIVNF